MSKYNLTGEYSSVEAVYKECLEKGVKWQDIIPKPDKNVLL